MSTSRIVLIDLRDPGVVLPTQVAGGVVVIDDAATLVDHAETYLALLSEDMVSAVVCVAVGEAATDNPLDGVVLTVPPALQYATVLWVGDPRGVEWAPRTSVPRPVERPGEALDSLVAALLEPTLFDQVVAAGEGVSAINPGIRLVSGSADPVELAEARAAAVRSLCAPDHEAAHDLDSALRRSYLPQGREGAVLGGAVRDARAEAVRRLDNADELARLLGTVKALFGPSRPTQHLGRHVTWAGQAAENHRAVIAELLNRVDGRLQVGRPSTEDVVELGVPRPREADSREIAADLRQAVDARLDQGAALATLAHELRLVSANSGPQGCTAAIDEVGRRGPVTLAMPVFRRFPLSLPTLPLIFLTCALLTLLLGGWLGWLTGFLFGAAWFGAGWLLLGRRPGEETEFGLEAAVAPAGLVYGLPAAAGVVAGGVAAQQLSVRITRLLLDVPGWLPAALVLLMVVIAAGTVVLSWRGAVREWRRELRVAAVRGIVGELTSTAEEIIAREWLPMLRRQALSAAALEVAAGLEEISATLQDAGNRLFVSLAAGNGHGLARPVPQELYAVVRADLLDVSREALHPAWGNAEKAMQTGAGVYAQRLESLLGEYGADVRRNGLMTATRFSRDQGPRDALMARVWSDSPAALAALRTDVSGDMIQLCRSGQLGYLSTTASPGLVRFAPLRLRQVLERDGVYKGLIADPGVAWSEGGELVGALRLMPLRPESVRQVLGGVR